MSAQTTAPAEQAPEPTAIEPSRVLVLNDDEQRLLIGALQMAEPRDEGGTWDNITRLLNRIAHGDEYVNEADELTRVTLRKRRLEDEVRRCNRRIQTIEPDLVDEWLASATAGMKHEGTGATLSIRRDIWAKLDVDTDDLDKEAAAEIRAEIKAQAGEALKRCGLGDYVRADFNLNSISAYFREQIRAYDEEQRELPEHKRVPRDADSFLPDELRGLIHIDDDPHIQVRS